MLLFYDAWSRRENPESTLAHAWIARLAGLEQCTEELAPAFACYVVISLDLSKYVHDLTVVGILSCNFRNSIADLVPDMIDLFTSETLQ